MRCLTLADGLKERGANCRFVCREHTGSLLDLIRQRGFKANALPIETTSDQFQRDEHGLQGSSHEHWLGAGWRDDAEQTINVMGDAQFDWVIVDHYALDEKWERRLRPVCKKLMVIDDLADRRHDCDILLDQNWFGEKTEKRYHSIVPEGCKCMLGPTYALLNHAYPQLRALMPSRDGIVNRILVFLGGSDPTNETGKVLEALMQPSLMSLTVDVVIGLNHPAPEQIKRLGAVRPRTSIHCGVPSLAGMMARSDLMVAAGGTTTWERMCLGLPSIVICVAENQVLTNQSLMRAGYVDYLGWRDGVSSEDIAGAIFRKIKKPDELKMQSALCQSLVSGNGVDKLCDYFLNGVEA